MKILIIGLGSIALKHIKALKSVCVNSTIYALRSSKNGLDIADIINVYSMEEIGDDLDFVIISNPSNLHSIYIEHFILRNIPVFVEKPVVTDLDSLKFIKAVLKDSTVPTYVGCNLRFRSALMHFKDLMSQKRGDIKEVNIYCGSYLPDWRVGKDYRKSYSAESQKGGGVHLDLFHELDYAVWLFGFPDASSIKLRKTSELEINSWDFANYILMYETYTINIVLNYYRPIPKRVLEVVLSDDVITVDLLSNCITSDIHGVMFRENTDLSLTYIDQMRHFMDVVNGRSESINTIQDSLEVLEIILN